MGLPHPKIGLPATIFGERRDNSQGLDLSDEFVLTRLEESRIAADSKTWAAGPVINGVRRTMATRTAFNPSDQQTVIGQVTEAGQAEVNDAVSAAVESFIGWSAKRALASVQWAADSAMAADRSADARKSSARSSV